MLQSRADRRRWRHPRSCPSGGADSVIIPLPASVLAQPVTSPSSCIRVCHSCRQRAVCAQKTWRVFLSTTVTPHRNMPLWHEIPVWHQECGIFMCDGITVKRLLMNLGHSRCGNWLLIQSWCYSKEQSRRYATPRVQHIQWRHDLPPHDCLIALYWRQSLPCTCVLRALSGVNMQTVRTMD